VPLDGLNSVIQELFGGIAALLGGTPDYSYSILDWIGNRSGCARDLPS